MGNNRDSYFSHMFALYFDVLIVFNLHLCIFQTCCLYSNCNLELPQLTNKNTAEIFFSVQSSILGEDKVTS